MDMNIEQKRADFEVWYEKQMGEAPKIAEDTYTPFATACWEAYQAGRAALQSQPATLDMENIEYELRNMASTMYEFSMSFGVGRESFERMANDVFSYARSVLQSQFDEETKHLRDALWVAQKKLNALQSQDREGWKEAAIAWEVCASLHREYCKGKDPFYKTRQADFVKHAEASREKALRPCSTEDKTDAEPEFPSGSELDAAIDHARLAGAPGERSPSFT